MTFGANVKSTFGKTLRFVSDDIGIDLGTANSLVLFKTMAF
jgi:actin-like ATPase involved in cell morphogenesis